VAATPFHQDAYSDSMEARRSGMEVSVDGPGDHPLVPGPGCSILIDLVKDLVIM